jgi:hypothetical protein
MEDPFAALRDFTPQELAGGAALWLELVDGGQLTAQTPSERRFLAFLQGAAAALEVASQEARPASPYSNRTA